MKNTIFIYLYRNGVLIKSSYMPVDAFKTWVIKLYKGLNVSIPEQAADVLIHDIETDCTPTINSPVNNMIFEFTR